MLATSPCKNPVSVGTRGQKNGIGGQSDVPQRSNEDVLSEPAVNEVDAAVVPHADHGENVRTGKGERTQSVV